jgi:hypothetical protein
MQDHFRTFDELLPLPGTRGLSLEKRETVEIRAISSLLDGRQNYHEIMPRVLEFYKDSDSEI